MEDAVRRALVPILERRLFDSTQPPSSPPSAGPDAQLSHDALVRSHKALNKAGYDTSIPIEALLDAPLEYERRAWLEEGLPLIEPYLPSPDDDTIASGVSK